MPENPPQLSLDDVDHFISTATRPEDIRDVACLVFFKLLGRFLSCHLEPTGFEDMSIGDLQLAFFHSINELVHRAT